MGTVILSPHLDDAVLSCWHVLTQPGEVMVINVFAGVPTGLEEPAWWDRYTAAADSGERVRERIEEDRRALSLAGRIPVNLDLLDEQYRDGQPPPSLTGRLREVMEPGALVYAPAALADHADHRLVRAAALELRAQECAVFLYADLPHANVRGWPQWVTGASDPASKDLVGAFWDRCLVGTGIPPDDLAPKVHDLGAEAYARKVAAVRMYTTQVAALTEYAGRPLSDHEALGYEVFWATALATRAADRAASHP
jgi:LmbE family N-acetylglucosaminyl deacetylase